MMSPSASTPLFRRKSFWIATSIVVILAASGGFMMQKANGAKSSDTEKKADTPVTLEFAATDIAVVNVQSLARRVSISGSLTPVTQSMVKSTVAGQVRRVLVREGETIKQGDVVAEIDTADLRSRLDAAEAEQEERRTRMNIAVRNRDTNKALLKQNFISQNAYDQTQSTYQGSEAAVRWAEAQVKLAQKAMADAIVRSPIAGKVAKRLVNSGERILPDAPIVNVVDLSRLELEATVPASDVPSISVGQAVQFHVDGFGERQFEGTVERINPVAEPGSRAIKLFVAVANADQSLKGGMFAEGSVTLSKSQAIPVIPGSAVFEEAGQSYVFAIENGKLAKSAVNIGLRDEATGLVEVKSGLNAGANVVRIRMGGLKAGAPAVVRAVSPAPSSEKEKSA